MSDPAPAAPSPEAPRAAFRIVGADSPALAPLPVITHVTQVRSSAGVVTIVSRRFPDRVTSPCGRCPAGLCNLEANLCTLKFRRAVTPDEAPTVGHEPGVSFA